MADKTELLIEANRRGLLTGSRKAAFDEAVRRGIIHDPYAGGDAAPAAMAAPQGASATPGVEPQDAGDFMSRAGEIIDRRRQEAQDIFAASDSQTLAETGLQLVGKSGVGTALELAGEAVSSGVQAITPEPVQEAVGTAVEEIMDTETAQAVMGALSRGIETYQDFAKENPRAARNLEAAGNVAMVFAPAKVKASSPPVGPPKSTMIGKAGTAVTQAGRKQEIDLKEAFVEDLVQPKQTAAVKTAQASRTEVEGPLKSKRVVPTKQEQDMASVVRDIDGVDRGKTVQENLNAIQSKIAEEATSLQGKIAAADVEFDASELLQRLDGVKARLSQVPVIVGDAERSAGRLLDKWQELVSKHPSTGSGLLAARKEFDRWVEDFKPTAFDPKTESALTIALREIRTEANDFLAEKVPNVEVKRSLRDQSLMYRAVENIAPKAADEANNMVMRAWQNVTQVLPFRGEFNQVMATLFGIGGLGASAMFAPIFTQGVALGLGTYATGKFLTGPKAKRGLGRLLREMDKAIKVATNPEMIKQLKADRAAIAELARTAATVSDETTAEPTAGQSPSQSKMTQRPPVSAAQVGAQIMGGAQNPSP